MRCAVLAGLLLGQQAVCSQAIAVKSSPHRSGPEMDMHTLTHEGVAADEAQRTGVLTDLDAEIEMDVKTGTLSDLDADNSGAIGDGMADSGATVTLSPEQRKDAFAWGYTADFWAEINMTRARETGMSLGLMVESDEEWKPVHIKRVKKNGLVQEWNKAHPDKAIYVKDEILQVNHIQYHHNATSFQQRIIGQVDASKKGIPGARDMLSLHIVRPRQQSQKRYQLQREDAHNKLYAAEFTAKIPMPTWPTLLKPEEPGRDAQVAAEMGWTLKDVQDWNPVSILEINPSGILARWNEANPENLILPGDEILRVNTVGWPRNTTVFLTRIWQQYVASRDHPELNHTFSLVIRRPRPVQELYDQQHPIEVYETTKNVSVELTLSGVSLHSLGWQLGMKNGDLVGMGRVTIDRIDDVGPIADWNRGRDPLSEDEIKVGDQLTGVDFPNMNIPLKAANSLDVAQSMEKVEDAARTTGGQPTPLRLMLERRVKATRRLSAPKAAADADVDATGPKLGSGWVSETGAKNTESLSDDGFVGAED